MITTYLIRGISHRRILIRLLSGSQKRYRKKNRSTVRSQFSRAIVITAFLHASLTGRQKHVAAIHPETKKPDSLSLRNLFPVRSTTRTKKKSRCRERDIRITTGSSREC